MHDDELCNGTSSSMLTLSSYIANIRRPTPILAPPSDSQDEWTVMLADTVQTQTVSREILVVTSSVAFARAIDELCAMMTRLSIQDVDSEVVQHSDYLELEDICRLLGVVSIEDASLGGGETSLSANALEDGSLCAPSTIHDSDEESTYDGSSDSTFIEEDSTVSCSIIYEEGVGEVSPPHKNDGLSQDALSCLNYPHNEKWNTAPSFLPAVTTRIASSDTCVVTFIGLWYWTTTPPSFSSLFAPALRATTPL